MRRLSLREQRLVAVLVLLSLLTLVYLWILAPLFGGFADRQATRDGLAQRYARDEQLIGQAAMLRRQATRQASDGANFALKVPSGATALEAVNARLSTAVAQVGGVLRGVENQSAPTGKLRVRLTVRLNLAQLAKLLADLQNQPPMLAVSAMTLVADDAVQSGRTGLMDVTLDLEANHAPS